MADFKPGAGLAVSLQFPGGSAAPSQTDLFVVDQMGRLNVFWVDGAGSWNGPGQIGAAYAFVPGSVPAVTYLPGDDKIALFIIDKTGQLSMFWVEGYGQWQGPVLIGPPGHFNPGATVAASPQFGTAQLDVFAVDKSGQLTVCWGGVPAGWNGPVALSGPLFTHGQAPSASRRFGGTANRTDVFVNDDLGNPNYFSVIASGQWSGAQVLDSHQNFDYAFPAAVIERVGTAETMALQVNRYGELVAFTADGAGNWGDAASLSAANAFGRGACVAASQQFGVGAQTDVFVIDQSGQLNVFWIGAAGGWNGPAKIGPAGLLVPGSFIATSQQFGISGQTDVFAVSAAGEIIVFYVVGSGAWTWGVVPVSTVTPPPAGFDSNTNYIISNQCQNLIELCCEIAVTQDITYTSDTGSDTGVTIDGMSFQLNCNCPQGFQNAYVQYDINFQNGTLTGLIDWWSTAAAPYNKTLGWSNNICNFANKTIPAGTRLRILLTTDSNQNVHYAQFMAIDGQGKELGNTSIDLTTVSPVAPYASTILSPIVACTMNIVGPGESENVVLLSGAGTITYSQDGGPLIAGQNTPLCAQQSFHTLETSNVQFGMLPPLSQNSLIQSFVF